MDIFVAFFNAAVIAGTPLLFGTLGEILTEKSGNLNLGVEGMMFMGAISGLVSVSLLETTLGIEMLGAGAVIIAMLFAFIAGALGALIYSILVVSLRTQQNVTGLALTIFGVGFGNFFGEYFRFLSPDNTITISIRALEGFSNIHIPILSDIPIIGQLFFSYNILVYLAVAIAIIMAFFLNRTRVGLNLRAVGESPATADAACINVTKYKYIATCVGGGICGIGGMYIVMITTGGNWVHDSIYGYGWIAVALVIFATWSPSRALLGALIFGIFKVMRFYLPLGIPIAIYDLFPYFATILVLVATSIRAIKESSPPAQLGNNYFREER